MSLAIFEELLNNTGYIVQLLPISNYAESFNFTFAPLFYLYVRSSLRPNEKGNDWVHFIFAALWLVYMILYFIQTDEFKYNSYIEAKHPDWGYLNVDSAISDDPIGIRNYINEILPFHFLIYFIVSISLLMRKVKSLKQTIFKTNDKQLILLRNTTIHFIFILLIFIFSKIYFEGDIGDYLSATYISFLIYITSYQVLNKSDFFNQPNSFLTFPILKYQKSSLSDENKEIILGKIKKEMEETTYFTNNLASLSGLAKKIGETTHHVSQVINQKMKKSFFELLASYRVEHAKKLIKEDKNSKLT